MGGRRSAYDNAVCESFFKTLKSDLVDRRSWPDKAELRTAVFDYIECFYNANAATRASAHASSNSMNGPSDRTFPTSPKTTAGRSE